MHSKNKVPYFIILLLAIVIYALYLNNITKSLDYSLEYSLLVAFSGINPLEDINIVIIIFYILFPLIILFSFSNEYVSVFNGVYIYYIMRNYNITNVLVRKSLGLFIKTCLAVLLCVLAYSGIGFLLSIRIENVILLGKIIFLTTIMYASLLYLYILICNYLSLRIGITLSFIMTSFIYCILFIMTLALHNIADLYIMVIPNAHSFILWHDTDLINCNFAINGFFILYSFLYFAIIILVMNIIIMRSIKNFDVLDMSKEVS